MKPEAIVIDSEFSSLLRPLTDAEVSRLALNLERDGRCIKPLIVWKGKNILLDGHHRLPICEELGLKFDVVELDFPDRAAAAAWIREHQDGQRNRSEMDAIEEALRMESIIAAEAKQRMHAGKAIDPAANLQQGRTASIVATDAGASERNVHKVKAIQRSAAEPIADMARAGDVSIDAAAKVATLPKAEQRAVAKRGPKAVKAKAAEIRKATSKSTPKTNPPPPPADASPVPSIKLANPEPTWRDAAPIGTIESMNAGIDSIVNDLEAVSRKMRELFEVRDKRITARYAARLTHSGTLVHVRALIHTLENNRPVGEDATGILVARDIKNTQKKTAE